MTTLVIDMGGSRIKMAVATDKQMDTPIIFPVDSTAPLEDTLQTVVAQGQLLLRHAGLAPDAVSLALPCIVRRGHVIACNGKYQDAIAFNWEKWCRHAFGASIHLINDAAAALYGEMHDGAAQDAEAVVMLIIGTGIGTAAALHGRVLEGRHGTMGMLGGHIGIEMLHPRACTCGNTGCLEAWAGTWALNEIAHAAQAYPHSVLAQYRQVDYLALASGVQQNDPLSLSLMDTMIRALGMGAVNLIHAYDPEVLLLSGGPCHIQSLCDGIGQYVRKNAWTPWGQVDVRVASNPESSVLWGLHHYAQLDV